MKDILLTMILLIHICSGGLVRSISVIIKRTVFKLLRVRHRPLSSIKIEVPKKSSTSGKMKNMLLIQIDTTTNGETITDPPYHFNFAHHQYASIVKSMNYKILELEL
jgi:hypothetical protein